MASIDPRLLEILACPACKSEVVLKGEKLVCVECRRAYPIRDGIPIMLIEEAVIEEEKGQNTGQEVLTNNKD
ncbi:MAG: Trm112 family protein [Armatimonadota bacterium]